MRQVARRVPFPFMSSELSQQGSGRHEREPATSDGVGGERLLNARVLIVGMGKLGATASLHLVAAGVGRLGVADPREVEARDADRAVLYRAADAGASKADTAAARLSALSTDVQVDPYPAEIVAGNANAVIEGHDLVVDCSNDHGTGLALNDACAELEVPFSKGFVIGFGGWVALARPHEGPCYRCLFDQLLGKLGSGKPRDEDLPREAAASAIAGTLGSMQALEAIKLLAGVAEPVPRVLELDGLEPSIRVHAGGVRAACRVCADKEPALGTAS
jgi:molybdopterin/thiamine biosynthesis adenylyltransferase